jgi:hypothetical protein
VGGSAENLQLGRRPKHCGKSGAATLRLPHRKTNGKNPLIPRPLSGQ